MLNETTAQGSIEYLLIIGAVILVVAVVIIAISGVFTDANKQADTNDYNNSLTVLRRLL